MDQRNRKIVSLKATITSLEGERRDLRVKLRDAQDVLDQKERQLSSLQAVVRERDQQISSLEPCRSEVIRYVLYHKCDALSSLIVCPIVLLRYVHTQTSRGECKQGGSFDQTQD